MSGGLAYPSHTPRCTDCTPPHAMEALTDLTFPSSAALFRGPFCLCRGPPGELLFWDGALCPGLYPALPLRSRVRQTSAARRGDTSEYSRPFAPLLHRAAPSGGPAQHASDAAASAIQSDPDQQNIRTQRKTLSIQKQ